MSGHTPGPWVVDALDPEEFYLDVRGASGHLVAEVAHAPDQDHEANARLIAAAPELLEAVRRLMGLHDVEADQTYCFNEKCGECDECFARAAIAKATGGKP